LRFRPCIDLHEGRVKQIVGSTLLGTNGEKLVTNFQSEKGAAYYANLYKQDNLPGGHVIMLGPGNQRAAIEALKAYPGGMQVGGGITPANATDYLQAGASHVIVTSYVFHNGQVDLNRLQEMVSAVGAQHLVLDLSCRRRGGCYYVVTDRWQVFTEFEVNITNLILLAEYCAEFLIHAVDVEGKRQGMDEELIIQLAKIAPCPVTYAGGASELADLERVNQLGHGRVDLTIGSALDIFGGNIPYREVVAWQRAQQYQSDTNQTL
jgi:phosphoribosylformimino-5-aminoimidazole carboxamide ribotide isomerase